MLKAKFNHNKKEYILNEANCSGYYNDEEKPIEGLEFEEIINLLNKEVPYVDTEFFDTTCENCHFAKPEGLKTYPFMELSFSVFAKEGQYVMSSLSEDYEELSFNKLERRGLVDSMYIVMVVICPECNDYTVELVWVK